MITSKYFKVEKEEIKGRKTPIYTVFNLERDVLLGHIVFYPAWRKFVFQPAKNTIFDTHCLNDVIHLLEDANRDWREGLK